MKNLARKWTTYALVLGIAVAASGAAQYASVKAGNIDSGAQVGTLSVVITPTHTVPPFTTCTWTANVTGGTSPYSYAWAVNNSPVGFDSPTLSYTTGNNAFRIQVTVTDATSSQAADSKIINVSSGFSC